MDHHKRILELCYYSKGSISISEAYNLPIPYRYMYIRLMNEIRTEENEHRQKATQKTSDSGTMSNSFKERNEFDYLNNFKKR